MTWSFPLANQHLNYRKMEDIKESTDDQRLDCIIKMILKMAQGNFHYHLDWGKENDKIASIMVCLTLLAEETEARAISSVIFPDFINPKNLPTMIFCLDSNGNLEDINENALLELNFEKEALVGRPLTKFLTEDSQIKWNKLNKRLSADGTRQEALVSLDFMTPSGLVVNKYCTIFKTNFGLNTILGALNGNHSVKEIWGESWVTKKNGYILQPNYSPYDRMRIKEAKDFIRENLYQGLPTTKKLSTHVGLNDAKLRKGFKEIYGTSIQAYTFQLRLRMAKALIKKSNLPIQTIILDSGFKSISHFYQVFKAKYGMTPAAMRKLYQNP